MNGINWVAVGQFAIAVGLGGVIVAIINNFLSPKVRAETRQIASGEARQIVNDALSELRAQVRDAQSRATAAEERADKADRRADEADARADEADRKYDVVLAQNRIFIEFIWRITSWAKRVYEAGHPDGMEPPPVLEYFDQKGAPDA